MTAGAYILAPAATSLSEAEVLFFREADPWGFILFARNIDTPGQVGALTAALRDCVGRNAPILIDQEGGRVQRLRGPTWREWEPPLVQVEAFSDPSKWPGAARAMYLRGLLIGAELVSLGIDCNCAPSADIAFPQTHPFLRNRCYGTSPLVVEGMARNCAEGLLDAGCLPVLKHAPGHGRAMLDSHETLPVVDASIADLNVNDFAPFRGLSNLPMAMTAHLVVSALDTDVPVTLSATAMTYLRKDMSLNMLMMTDDISMGALSGPISERSASSIAAGCDVVLHCNGDMGEMEEVAYASGTLNEQAEKRAEAALAQRRTPSEIDIPAVEAELGPLLRESAYA